MYGSYAKTFMSKARANLATRDPVRPNPIKSRDFPARSIPINDSLLYVEPIYLRAETAAYPELRLVAVMQGDNLSYAPSFDEALLDLVAGTRPLTAAATRSVEALAEDARRAFDDYLEALAERRFQDAAAALELLSEALEQLDPTP